MSAPERYVVELRPPRKGERYVSTTATFPGQIDRANVNFGFNCWVVVGDAAEIAREAPVVAQDASGGVGGSTTADKPPCPTQDDRELVAPAKGPLLDKVLHPHCRSPWPPPVAESHESDLKLRHCGDDIGLIADAAEWGKARAWSLSNKKEPQP